MAGYIAQSSPGAVLMPGGRHPAMRELSPTRTVVFLSRSMPESDLLALLRQGAGRKDVVFAFRGWGDGPVTDMFAYVHSLMEKLPPQIRKQPPQIIVLPAAFRAYRIHYAPAVLHRDNDGKWYLLQGAKTLDGAVAAIRARSFGERVSRQYRVSEPDQAGVMREKMRRKDLNAEISAAGQSINRLAEGGMTLPAHREPSYGSHTPYIAAAADIVHPKTGAVLYPKGTRFNPLALDPHGKRALAVIDGRSRWQVAFARHLFKAKPDTLVLYTRLGTLADEGFPAYPLDKAMQGRLKVTGVPTYYRQSGYRFDVFTVRPGDAS